MSMRYPGGLIAPTPVNQQFPSGVWTGPQSAPYQANNVWGTDPYFKNTTLLLPGNGTNGKQNNTFLDSSTNNSTINRNGSVTQGTWSPYGANWSNYFTGANSLSFATNAAFSLNSSAFTIEAWVCLDGISGSRAVTSTYGGTTGWSLQFNSGILTFYRAGDTVGITATTTISAGVWYHIAVSGTAGTSMKLFINGVQEGSTSTGNITDSSTALSVAQLANTNYLAGYVSNLRIIKGTALYTSNFTPPTSPLTAITNTSLLTCQANRFIDSSANAFTCSLNGSPTVQRFSPFAPTTVYDAAAIGGSSYYDGSSYLSVPTSTAAFDFGSGNYTLEFWYYPISFATQSWSNGIVTKYNYQYANYSTGGFGIENPADGTGYIVFKPYAPAGYYTNTVAIEQANALTKGMWQHIAMVKSGTTAYAFINGVVIGTATVPSATAYGSHDLFIGAWDGMGERGIQKLNGFISGLRIVKSAVYTAAFTPPTTPPTAIANTSFLANFTNAGITDSTELNDLTTVGNAQISTNVVKYGNASMYFDGTGDWLISSANSSLYAFGTGDFTIEFWIYIATTQTRVIYDSRPASTQGAYPELYLSSNQIIYYHSSANQITGSTLANTTWYHIALCRSGTSTKLFVDGAQVGSTYTDSTNYLCGTNRPTIGVAGNTLTDAFNGYIDDLRVTKGVARYVTNFTPPVARMPNQ